MIKYLDESLSEFRGCFSRKATFEWFVAIVVGLLVRTDHLGVTSVIRGLFLSTEYVSLLGFFRSRAWKLENLTAKWCSVVSRHAPLVRVNGAVVMVGDGVKQSKEGRRMPGVKRQHQESEDSSKAEYMFGHLFGGVGILAETARKCFCIPLALRLQDGVKTIFGWGEKEERQASHVVEMIRLAYSQAVRFGKSILLLDRLFLTVPALQTLDEVNAGGHLMNIITKAKSNCIAYEPPEIAPGKRGRPKKKGEKIKLFDMFAAKRDRFINAEICLYGKPEQVRYYCVDLLWGQSLYKNLRFVLVEYNNTRSILVSTDLMLEPISIIELYGRRFCIEIMFREMKQVICSFGYRFWSKHMPKLNRFKKKTDPDPLDEITDQRAKNRITLAIKAIEGFVFCATVATGLLQMVSLTFSGTDELGHLRFLRTRRNAVVSEATVADFLRKNFFRLLLIHPDLPITRIISDKQSQHIESQGVPVAS